MSGGSRIAVGAPTDWVIKAVGDFNADGWSDILWYNTSWGGLAVWALQNGTIVANVSNGAVDPSSGWAIKGVADLDRDGVSDIIWRHTDGTVSYWMLSSPSSVREYTSMANPGGTFVGAVDLGPPLPANPNAPPISESFCGASTGTLQNPGFYHYEQWYGQTHSGEQGTFLGDVNGDNKADLVAVGHGSVGVLSSTGTSFAGSVNWSSEYVFGNHGTLLGDMNGDEKADLIALTDTAVRVRTSTGGSFNNAGNWTSFGFYGSRGTFAGDVDGDNRADLVGVGDGYVGVIRSTGGGFGAYQQWWSGTFSGGFGNFLGDVTGDGRADLVTIGAGNVDVIRSTGSSFGARETWFTGTIQSGGFALLLGDVDGDGKTDLIIRGNGYIQVRRSTGTRFGDLEVWWPGTFHGSRGNFSGDVNGDGRADLIASATDTWEPFARSSSRPTRYGKRTGRPKAKPGRRSRRLPGFSARA